MLYNMLFWFFMDCIDIIWNLQLSFDIYEFNTYLELVVFYSNQILVNKDEITKIFFKVALISAK